MKIHKALTSSLWMQVMAFIWSLVCITDGWAAPRKHGFQVTPYLWIPSINADSHVAGQMADLDGSMDLGHFAGAIHFEAWAGAGVGLIGELMVLKMEPEGNLINSGATVRVNAEIRQRILELALSTRHELRRSASSKTHLSGPWFEFMGGHRFVDLEQELTLQPGGKLMGSEDWVEPFIGARIGFRPAGEWAFALRGDMGSFGWGSAAQLTWTVNAEFDYQLGRDVSIDFGYRIQDTDYGTYLGNGRFALDYKLMGPWLGVTFYY